MKFFLMVWRTKSIVNYVCQVLPYAGVIGIMYWEGISYTQQGQNLFSSGAAAVMFMAA